MSRAILDDAGAAHLLRRVGFEASLEERSRWIGLERGAAIERALALAPASLEPTSAGAGGEYARLLAGARFLEDQASIERLQAWWMARLRCAETPWIERLALFWHGHFATSDAKVQDARKMLHQHRRFLELGAGRFPLLLEALIEDPALLVWLDAAENTKASPNENLSRELLELFSLGRGAYTEHDVREAARALSGLRVRREKAEMRWGEHDNGPKKIFGSEAPFTPRAVARLATAEPACARFLARKLLACFVEAEPSEERLAASAERLRASALDVRAFLADELASESFWSAGARRTLWKSPVEYVAGAVRQLALRTISPRRCTEHATAMGQALFLPPNVGGWPGGSSWISAASMAARARFALEAADELAAREQPRDLEALLAAVDLRELASPAREACARALEAGRTRDVWVALLTHPLYQRA